MTEKTKRYPKKKWNNGWRKVRNYVKKGKKVALRKVGRTKVRAKETKEKEKRKE